MEHSQLVISLVASSVLELSTLTTKNLEIYDVSKVTFKADITNMLNL
jgi:hypothetical protein